MQMKPSKDEESPLARRLQREFADHASSMAHLAGRPSAFALAAVLVLAWIVSGPLFHFSDTWQLVINTGTTIVTFLMVFLIQNTQNRDGAAIQTKLDEIIRASKAHNAFVGIEHLTEEEIETLRQKCEAQARILRTAKRPRNDKRRSTADASS